MFKELRSLNKDDVISSAISGNIPLAILIKEFNGLKYITNEITENSRVGDLISAIENLPPADIKNLQYNFKRELNYINYDEVDNRDRTDSDDALHDLKIWTDSDDALHDLKIWVIKTVIKGFILISSILVIGIVSDSIVNPEKDNLKLIMEIFSSYGSILNIALGMK